MAMSQAAIRAGAKKRVRPTSGYVIDKEIAKANSIRLCPKCSGFRCKCRGMRKKKDGSAVRNWRCNTCGHSWKQQYADAATLVDARLLIANIATKRECTSCREIKGLSEFGKFKGSPRHVCKQCTNAAWSDRSLAKTLSHHGLTIDDYNSIYNRQRGLCVICHLPGKGKGRRSRTLCIDHCHKTGVFRGLLCDKCNLGLGNFNDSLERLLSAVSYLQSNFANGDK